MSYAIVSDPAHPTRPAHRSVRELAGSLGSTSPTLLAVWAHPDDEAYLGAGLMAAVAESGGRVVNVTATLGEHGTDDPDRYPPSVLASIRSRELTESLVNLGVTGSMTLGYTDGSCAEVPDALGARRIGLVIDRIRPTAILTFGPDGVTGHPDHRAIARWTARAVADRGDRTPLITTAAAVAWPDELVERMHQVDAFYPGYPDRTVDGSVSEVRLSGALLGRKMRALAAHQSQIGPVHTVLGPAGYRRLASHEAYRPANEIALRSFSTTPGRVGAAA